MTYRNMIQRYTEEKYFSLLISNNMPFFVYLGPPYLPDAELPYKNLKSHQSKIHESVVALRRKRNKRLGCFLYYVAGRLAER